MVGLGTGKVAIILQQRAHRQSRIAVSGIFGLHRGNGDAKAIRAVALGGKAHERAPAAADVEHGVARLKSDFAADKIELGILRLVQRRRLGPVAAAAGKAFVECRLENIDRQIVMDIGGLLRAPYRLAVLDARHQDQQRQRQGQAQLRRPRRREITRSKNWSSASQSQSPSM